ncbi:cytochrome c oxidase subunit NDUFA4-like [Homarus americanus]|uniref:cytochrome c oxidase subunit NDUFA4-like n=1 Tax=Homarus americanus TaxID=6706 RepID=UPI001C48B7A5|nr:cytochrome c oxidase subunit NDUFA4-like [Homarus americanus]
MSTFVDNAYYTFYYIGLLVISCEPDTRHIVHPAVGSLTTASESIKMQGITAASLKRHPALIPLYVCVGAGVVGAAFYTLRLATRNPDVTWNRVTNPEPQQEYAEKQYKFYSPVRDYATYRAPVPKFSE